MQYLVYKYFQYTLRELVGCVVNQSPKIQIFEFKTFDLDLTGALKTQTSSFGKWSAILQIYGCVPRGPVSDPIENGFSSCKW